MSRFGILGGTFDPVHLGHLIMASYAAYDLGLDRVLLMPAQTPPHKQDRTVSHAGHRVAMLERAIAPDSRLTVSQLDLQSGDPSYTSVLLERMTHQAPGDELVFIIGADSLRDLPTWHRPEEIIARAELAVARRPGVTIDDETLDSLPGLRDRTTIFTSPLIDISSTEIRQRVREGMPITWLVSPPVEAYILDHGLYR